MPEQTRLDELKARATELGIKFSPNIGETTLEQKIIDKETELYGIKKVKEPEAPKIPKNETPTQRRLRLKREASKLIRVRVNCLNPNKRNWPGEIISVGNANIGTWKKYVPFNLETGYHIPQIIYNVLVNRECQIFYKVKGKDGRPDVMRGKLIKEFNVEVLPALTKKELEKLAARQAVSQAE